MKTYMVYLCDVASYLWFPSLTVEIMRNILCMFGNPAEKFAQVPESNRLAQLNALVHFV